MTVTTTAPPFTRTTDFSMGAGLPSRRLWLTHAEQHLHEDLFVDALRQYVDAIARQCLHDSPTEYEDYINDLTEATADDAPTRHDVRFAHLLHCYADYMPSPDCELLDANIEGCQVWLSPTGAVVIDLVTTLTLSELSPFDDQEVVMRALREGQQAFGSTLVGVRHIVLDAPHESSVYRPPNAGGEPFLTSSLNSDANGGEW